MPVRSWRARSATSEAQDKALAEESTSILEAAFSKNGLDFDEAANGPISVESLRFWHGQEGVAVPEAFFIDPDDRLTRVSLPLKVV